MFHFQPTIPIQLALATGVHPLNDINARDNLAKAGIAQSILRVSTRSMQLDIVDGINVQVGSARSTGKGYGILLVRVVGRIFWKEQLRMTLLMKASRQVFLGMFHGFAILQVLPGIGQEIGKGRSKQNVSPIVMKTKTAIVKQLRRDLFQKQVHGMGHDIEGGQFNQKVEGMVVLGELDFKFDPVRTLAESVVCSIKKEQACVRTTSSHNE